MVGWEDPADVVERLVAGLNRPGEQLASVLVYFFEPTQVSSADRLATGNRRHPPLAAGASSGVRSCTEVVAKDHELLWVMG